jgi:hypothetical protein
MQERIFKFLNHRQGCMIRQMTSASQAFYGIGLLESCPRFRLAPKYRRLDMWAYDGFDHIDWNLM